MAPWLLLASAAAMAQTRPLNDTGIDFCGAATSGNAPCDGSQPAGQDAQYGRDAQAAAGTLTKIGGGGKGFDFTALDASGNPTTPSSGATPHPCVRDNVTGLIWEVKTDDGGLHDKDWTYTWYDSVHNYLGNPGAASGGHCGATVAAGCDTEKFVAAVKAASWCGYLDWRMPTVKELKGIVDLGRINPTIDPTYFPNTWLHYWSGSPAANDANHAWSVEFLGGRSYSGNLRYSQHNVRLVSDGKVVMSPPTVNALPRVVSLGGSAELSWDTNNGNESLCSLTANGAPLYTHLPAAGDPETGSATVTVHVTTTYILTCPHGADWVTVEALGGGGET
jgi:hypothetical protein